MSSRQLAMEHVTLPRRDRHSCTEAAGEGGECAGTRPAAQPQRDGAPHPCGPALSEAGGAPVRGGWSPLSEVDGIPHQRWMESPARDGRSPPSEADGAPRQRRTEHHVPEALPWPRPPVLLGPFPRLRP